MEACVCNLTYGEECGPDFDDDGELCHHSAVLASTSACECTECDDEIPAGTEHEIARACYDGQWVEYHTCLGCMRLRNDIMRCGWRYGSVIQDIADAWIEALDDDLTDDEREAAEDEIWEALS